MGHRPELAEVFSAAIGDPIPGTLSAIGHLSSGVTPWLMAPLLLAAGLVLVFTATARPDRKGRSRPS